MENFKKAIEICNLFVAIESKMVYNKFSDEKIQSNCNKVVILE